MSGFHVLIIVREIEIIYYYSSRGYCGVQKVSSGTISMHQICTLNIHIGYNRKSETLIIVKESYLVEIPGTLGYILRCFAAPIIMVGTSCHSSTFMVIRDSQNEVESWDSIFLTTNN